MSGAVLGLTALLFYKVPEAREYIANELFLILKQSNRFKPSANLFNALWLLHISPNSEKGKEFFDYGRELINKNGGIPETFFSNALVNYIIFLDDGEMFEDYGEIITIPDWETFREIKKLIEINPDIVFDLAVNYLTSHDGNWNSVEAKQL